MTLTRRPDRNVVPLRNAIERLMGDWPFVQFDGGLTDLAPPIDVRETDDAYVVDMDVPGIDPKNLEILIEGRTLTIRGQMNEEREEKDGNYLLRERRQGQFMRAVALPGMVDVDAITTSFRNGQLTIELPKAAQNRARRIEVAGDGRASAGSRNGGGTSADRQDAAARAKGGTPSGGQAESSRK
ncbi:MAG TPA: Hsp20/alpha crystallin family protein [Candidatus Limnocylindrales bacterium]|jgi:HSP20 family protein